MKAQVWMAAAAAMMVAMTSAPALACRCANPAPSRAELFASSTYVFHGTVEDTGSGGPEPITIRIEKMYKGDAKGSAAATILDEGRGSSCDYFMNPRVGESYVFFTSNLADVDTMGCYSTIFAMEEAPVTLDAWLSEDASAPVVKTPPGDEPMPEAEPALEPAAAPKASSGGCASSSGGSLPGSPASAALALGVAFVGLRLRRDRL